MPEPSPKPAPAPAPEPSPAPKPAPLTPPPAPPPPPDIAAVPRWDGESVVGADQAVVEFNVDMGCAGLNFTEVWVTGAFCEWCSPYGGPYGGALQLFKTDEDASSAIFSGSFVFDADSMSLNDDGEPAVFYRYLADGWQQPEALNAIGGGGSSVEIAGSTVGPTKRQQEQTEQLPTSAAVTECPSTSGSAIFPHRSALVQFADSVSTSDTFGRCAPCGDDGGVGPQVPSPPPPPATPPPTSAPTSAPTVGSNSSNGSSPGGNSSSGGGTDPPIVYYEDDEALPGAPIASPTDASVQHPHPPPSPPLPPDDDGGSSSGVLIGAIAGAVAAVVALVGVLAAVFVSRRRARARMLDGAVPDIETGGGNGAHSSGGGGAPMTQGRSPKATKSSHHTQTGEGMSSAKGAKNHSRSDDNSRHLGAMVGSFLSGLLGRSKGDDAFHSAGEITLGSRVLDIPNHKIGPGSPGGHGVSPRPLRRHWAIDYSQLDFGEGEPRRLGRGAYGEVLCARLNGTRVAVKRYHMWEHEELVGLSDDPAQPHHHSGAEGRDLSSAAAGQGASVSLSAQGERGSTQRDGSPGEAVREVEPSFAFEELHADAMQARAEERHVADVRAFEQEMETLARLRHPNIVMFIGACVAPPNVSIVMELASGSLETLLHHSVAPLPRAARLRMLVGAARGMAYLHAQSPVILHMDLKPSNLLLGRGYEVKIADFGLSRFMGKGKTHVTGVGNGPCGTPGYIAPELMRGENFAQAVDLWSFGMCIYETWTRKRPYEKEMREGLAMQVMANVMLHSSKPELPPAEDPVDDTIAALYERCCAKEPRDRPSFEDVLVSLEEAYKQLQSQGGDRSPGA